MADLSTLLGSSWEDVDIPEVPEGTWKGELVRIAIDDEDREDRKGRTYRMVRFSIRPREPQEDVDPNEAQAFLEADPDGETIVTRRDFIYGKRDLNRVRHMLEQIGIPLEGRNIGETIDEYDGGFEVLVEVEHEEYEGETRAQARAIAPAA